jgi:ribosomal protein S18 acetylase RimI-like enzyme
MSYSDNSSLLPQAGAPQTTASPAWSCERSEPSPLRLLPASQFSWEELTQAYNQTRVDYIVPMPMNVARLREYVRIYDVNMEASAVAMEGSQILGLAMLGVRPERCWATRLGVLPVTRRHHVGQALMEYLIEQATRLGAKSMLLEVIQGNEPAHRLFKKLGFCEVRELLILRRPPGLPTCEWGKVLLPMPYTAHAMDHQHAIDLLRRYHGVPSWLNEARSLENAGNIAGLQVELKHGGRGWVVYQNTVFQLGRLMMQTEAGDPREVGQALLHALHTRHPAQDTNTENISHDDPHLPAMQDLGYLESFRRIEMRLDLL